MKKLFISALILVSCETTNCVPPVTPQMAAGDSKRQDVRHGTNPSGRRIDLAMLQQGRTLFVHRCIECHTLPVVWRYSTEDWPDIVNSMSHRASLKSSERNAIVAYILAARAQM